MATPSEMSMRVAIELLGMESSYRITDTASNNICPVCGNPQKPRKKKLHIDFRKGVFYCNKCGFSGGILDFWAFHRGISKEEASKDFWKTYNKLYGTEKKAEIRKRNIAAENLPEEKRADIKTIDRTYRALLDMLCLSDDHKKNLLERGLSEEAIEKGMYKSIPAAAASSLPKSLESQGFTIEGVPGFYKEKGRWKFLRYANGFLIPSMDLDGRIRALQLRRDKSDDGARYLTVSTDGYEKGTKGTAYPHFVAGEKGLKEVIITEGPLKGNIISYFTGRSVLAVMGVNSIKAVPAILKELRKRGTRSIKIAYDMDYIGNKHVEEACYKLEKMIYRLGFRYSRIMWDPAEQEDGSQKYKGLDDYLCGQQNKED